jgi:translation initiation factor 1
MSRRDKKQKIDTSGGAGLGQNLFGEARLISNTPSNKTPPAESTAPTRHAGRRIEVHRFKTGNGKWAVKVVGLQRPEAEQYGRALKKALGVGGTQKESQLEIHGDVREPVMEFLRREGFKPIPVGG